MKAKYAEVLRERMADLCYETGGRLLREAVINAMLVGATKEDVEVCVRDAVERYHQLVREAESIVSGGRESDD